SQNDSVGTMPERCLEKVANGHCRQPAHFTPRFESDKVCLRELEFGSVLDENDAVVFRDKSGKKAGKRSLARPCAARDKQVLSFEDVVFETIRKLLVERSGSDQILHGEAAGIELANGQSDAAKTAGRNYGGNAAAVRQARVEDGFCFGDIVSQASSNVLY